MDMINWTQLSRASGMKQYVKQKTVSYMSWPSTPAQRRFPAKNELPKESCILTAGGKDLYNMNI
ncbi:MAG: hypothetical protein IJV41_02200 [Oscillospiraceae bacterium]|nr:hypothetical protein [Oscillospiraceae bacterium]